MPTVIKWDGLKVQEAVDLEMMRRYAVVGVLATNAAKKLCSVDGTTKHTFTEIVNVKEDDGFNKLRRVSKGKDERGVTQYGYEIVTKKVKRVRLEYNTNPSSPGEPPHVQTGQLRASIGWEPIKNGVRIGSYLNKALWLEMGTHKMLPRPFLRRMLVENMGRFRKILTARILLEGMT